MRGHRLLALLGTLTWLGCSGAAQSASDAGGPDAGTSVPDAGDAGPIDAGLVDAGPGDAGHADAGEPDAGAPELYFAGDMQNVTTDGWNWTSGWSELGVIPLVHWFGTYQIGDGNTITVEPNGDGARNALKLTLADASKSVAKANFGVEFASTTDLAVYHTSHRMRLNEAFQYMADNLPDAVGPKGTVLGWMTIMEIWNSRDPNMTGDPGGSARWTLALKKAAGAPSPWTWELRGEYMQPDALLYSALFSSDNTTTPVPIESWFTLDLYLARGDGQSGRPDGRMVLTLTPDGGSPVVVFDVTGPTMYPGRPDLFVRDVEPLKVYTNPPVLSWVLNSGRQLEIQYNDFKWFKN